MGIEAQESVPGEEQSAPAVDNGHVLQRQEAAPAGEEAPPTEEAPPSESEKYTALAGRYAEIERRYRESERGRKADGEGLSDLTAKFDALQTQLKEDPYSLLEQNGHSYDKWTERLLQKTPEQEAASQHQALLDRIDALQKQVDERDMARGEERGERARSNNMESLTQLVGEREDLAYLSKLGQTPILYERLATYQKEHGECPADVQEAMTVALEAESREIVASNLEALVEVPHFKELLLTLAGKLGADGNGPGHEGSEPPKEATSNGVRPPTSITQTQAAAGTERKDPGHKRSRAERRQAIYKRMEERANNR